MRDIPIVHIYSQEDQHDDAFIIANREGLLIMQKAIFNALEKKKSIAKVYVADGEGYNVKILMNNTEWPSNNWNVLAIPYISACAREIVSPIVQPWNLWETIEKFGYRMIEETFVFVIVLVEKGLVSDIWTVEGTESLAIKTAEDLAVKLKLNPENHDLAIEQLFLDQPDYRINRNKRIWTWRPED